MASVVFDWTRIVFALDCPRQDVERRPFLHILELAKVVEAIVLCDTIYTTEPARQYQQRWKPWQSSPFNLSKNHYQRLFTEIVTEIPAEVQHKAAKKLKYLEETRKEYLQTGQHFRPADIASLKEVRDLLRLEDFQFLWQDYSQADDVGILCSMDRTRVLLAVAELLQAPYDPTTFRVPLVVMASPANLAPVHLRPYRKFESEILCYVAEAIGESPALRLPLMFNVVLSEMGRGSADDIIKIALELRDRPDVQALREYIDQFVVAHGTIDVQRIASAMKDTQHQVLKLQKVLEGSRPLADLVSIRLKPTWFPLEISFDVMGFMDYMRRSGSRVALSNLSKLTLCALSPLQDTRQVLNRMLGTSLVDADFLKTRSRDS